MVCFRDIDTTNFADVIKLQVHDYEVAFVAPVVRAIAESKVWGDRITKAIYDGDNPVGFLMYSFSEDALILHQLMIDVSYRWRGFGRAAVEELQRVACECGAEVILLKVAPDNTVAISLYTQYGFVNTGMSSDGEVIFAKVTGGSYEVTVSA